MTVSSTGSGPVDIGTSELRRLQQLRERLADESRRMGCDDLLRLLDDLPPVETDAPVRVYVVGETKRGKSTLLNALVGRPQLSPVGVDVTTSCWVEVRYGDRELAEVILANPDSLGRSIRRRCELDELERYVALDQVREPVIGVEVHIPAPALRNLVLVDTPAIGGLLAGHTRTTLAALRTADALLFVCDSRQPVLAPEIAFLVEAARRVPRVVVALTKRDINPDYQLVVDETRQRLTNTPGLGGVPVLAVATPLALLAAEVEDAQRSSRLRDLSGIGPLMDTLRGYSFARAALIRFENTARVLADVCRVLIARSDEILAVLAGNTQPELQIQQEKAELHAVLDDLPRVAGLFRDRLNRIRQEQLASFDDMVGFLRTRYLTAAKDGAATNIPSLAPQLIGGLCAEMVEALESIQRASTTAVVDLVGQLGGSERSPKVGLDLADLLTRRGNVDLTASAEMFAGLVEILAAPDDVTSVLTGPAVIAASLALATGAGYWRIAEGGEQEQRAALATWVEEVADQGIAVFHREIDERIWTGVRHVEQALPELIRTRRRELDRRTEELASIRSTSADLQAVLAGRRATASALHGVEQEIDDLVSRVRGPADDEVVR
jgi:hypothetical protein